MMVACKNAVESGEQPRMIIVRDKGTSATAVRLRPMFRENAKLKPKISMISLRDFSAFGL